MANLVLPIMLIIVVTISAISAYVADHPERKVRIRKTVVTMVVTAIVTIAVSILFGGVFYGACAEEEIHWQFATVNGSVECYFNGETMYLVVFTTEDGNVFSYYDDASVARGTNLNVKISPYGETLDVEVVEPEPVWFPAVLLMGLVAPVEKKFKRAQKMPPDFYLPCSLFDKNSYVVYFTNGKKCFIKVALPEALEYVRRASTKNIAAFVCAFVEEYKQQAIVACNYCDFLEYWQGTTISDRINDAYKALTVDVITNNVEPKLNVDEVMVIPEAETKPTIKDKDDPVKMIVKVKYSKSCNKLYTFTCRSAHFIGDYVTVEHNNGKRVSYKNAEVGFVGTMKQSELNKLAKSLGRKEIAEVYCEQAIDTEEAWEEWGGKDPRISTINPEDDPELYAPSAEEIAEFEAMRETMLGSGYRDF